MNLKILSLPIIFVFVFLCFTNTKAQQQNISIDLFHPVTIGDTFYSNFDGIAGVGIDYSYPINKIFFVGGKLGYTLSKTTYPPMYNYPDSYYHLFRGLMTISSPIKLLNKISLTPEVGLGYAFTELKNKELTGNSESGINTSLTVLFDRPLNKNLNLGFFTSYEFIYLGEPEEAFNIPYNKEMHSINIGLKILLKL